MTIILYLAAAIAIFATAMVVTRVSAVHSLLYLIVSLLAVAVIFYLLGAPFVAALEVIIYAGAIMVLFVFVIMMLNLGPAAVAQEEAWFSPAMLTGPAILAVILLGETVYAIAHTAMAQTSVLPIPPRLIGLALYGPYVLGAELASTLLLAGLVGAYHLGRRYRPRDEESGA